MSLTALTERDWFRKTLSFSHTNLYMFTPPLTNQKSNLLIQLQENNLLL